MQPGCKISGMLGSFNTDVGWAENKWSPFFLWRSCQLYCDQSSDPGGLQKSADGSRGPLLALGFHGKVELVYAFVGASEACMLVVPRVAATLDAPFLPSPGTHKEFDRMIDSSDDTEERSPKSKQEVQKALSMHCELASSWASSSRINIQKLESFATPGESCVTALIPLSKGTILVWWLIYVVNAWNRMSTDGAWLPSRSSILGPREIAQGLGEWAAEYVRTSSRRNTTEYQIVGTAALFSYWVTSSQACYSGFLDISSLLLILWIAEPWKHPTSKDGDHKYNGSNNSHSYSNWRGWSYHSIQDFSVKMLFMELMIEQASTLVESIVPWPRVEKCPSHSIIRPVSRVECNCSLLSNKDFSS